MKLKHLVSVAIIPFVMLGCAQQAASNKIETQTPSATTIASSVVESGKFQAGEQPTQGKVNVITKNGKRYLEFDQGFKTNEGPDLFVILYRSEKPPISGIKDQDYVSIARLQKTSGTQSYVLAKNIKLEEFKSVAIWCRKFNATFGYAALSI
ncbi:MAG: DM13 domain-containing protein [Gloeotrichia echinulata DVL01]|nr:DM13 domain-containing protein [Gloeotrichia echinulata DEX184]